MLNILILENAVDGAEAISSFRFPQELAFSLQNLVLIPTSLSTCLSNKIQYPIYTFNVLHEEWMTWLLKNLYPLSLQKKICLNQTWCLLPQPASVAFNSNLHPFSNRWFRKRQTLNVMMKMMMIKEQKELGLPILVGLQHAEHSLALSHYCSTRALWAAGCLPWPDSHLLSQPGHSKFPNRVHIDAELSADAGSTWPCMLQNSRPQTILKSQPPSSLDYRARHRPQLTWRRKNDRYESNMNAIMWNIRYERCHSGDGSFLSHPKSGIIIHLSNQSSCFFAWLQWMFHRCLFLESMSHF